MKKQIVIEVEESEVTSIKVFSIGAYPNKGYYLNTDENGNQALVYSTGPNGNCTFGVLLTPAMLSDLTILPTSELLTIPDSTGVITGDVLLKAIAIAQNPELAMNLLKNK